MGGGGGLPGVAVEARGTGSMGGDAGELLPAAVGVELLGRGVVHEHLLLDRHEEGYRGDHPLHSFSFILRHKWGEERKS